MRLAVKFFLAYPVVILVLAGIAAWSLRAVSRLSIAEPAAPVFTDAEALRVAGSLREAALVAKRLDMRSLIFADHEYVAASNAGAQRVREELDSIRTLVTTDDQKKLVERASARFDEYQAAVKRARALREAGNTR